MIDLTPLEVRQKKGDFRRAFRGYDGELVNDFLDLVADRMEELVKENMTFRDQVEELEQELVEFREKEKMLVDALMAAERLREEAREAAEKEAELLMREAELDAETHRTRAAQALAKEETLIRTVQARRTQLVREFRSFLERELAELAVAEDRLALHDADAEAVPDAGEGDAVQDGDIAGDSGEAEDVMPAEGEESSGMVAGGADAGGMDVADGDVEPPTAGGKGDSGSRRDRQTDWLSSLVEE